MSLYTVSFWLVTLFHVGFSIGSWFGLTDSSIWLVGDGKPGDGTTPIEKILDGVFAMWYMGTILGVLYANSLQHRRVPLQVAMIPLLFYHFANFVVFGLTNMGASMNACNPEKISPILIGALHGGLGLLSLVIFRGA